jgi:hypothetical protein
MFGNSRAALFVPDALAQNFPDQTTEPMSNRADGLGVGPSSLVHKITMVGRSLWQTQTDRIVDVSAMPWRTIPRILFVSLVFMRLSQIYAAAATSEDVEISGNYTFLHQTPAGTDYPFGWLASITVKLLPAVGLTGEVGGHYHEHPRFGSSGPPPLRNHLYTFMVGPRIGVTRERFEVFGQVLVGKALQGNNYGDSDLTPLALQPGGGIDTGVSRHFLIRVQADYRLFNYNLPEPTVKHVRFATGLVFR